MRLPFTGLVAALALSGLSACSTPSVPIPPPEIDLSVLTFGAGTSAGTFTITGTARAAHDNAQFFVIDEQSGDGVITKAAADGTFETAPFAAATGDTVRVQLEATDGRMSDPYCVKLTPGVLSGDICGQ